MPCWPAPRRAPATTSTPTFTTRVRAIRRYAEASGAPYYLRSPERIEQFFGGLDLVDPGVVSVSRWRVEPGPFGLPDEVHAFCGVGRKR